MNRRLALSLAVVLLGCDTDDTADGAGGDTDVFGDNMPDDLPAGNCGGVGGGENCDTDGEGSGVDASTGVGEANCLVDGCTGQGVCAASWDAEAEVRGEFECRFACVPLLDDASWCSDDASCCDTNARCTSRGYCVIGADETGSSTGDTDASGGESGDTDASTGGETTGTGGGG